MAALLLVRGMAEARSAAAEGDRLRERLVLESALETIIADMSPLTAILRIGVLNRPFSLANWGYAAGRNSAPLK